MRYKDEDGQAILLVALGMSIFLFGAIGLAVDGSHLYSQRQMAQAAADAAAQAGIMSIFDGTNGSGAASFSTASTITCSSTGADAKTPCFYANQNGFGGVASDTVTVDFPATSVAPGVSFSTTDLVPLIRVTVQRSVSTTLMALLGPSATTVTATAMAAIVMVQSPTPILITDPASSGTLAMNGATSITICGGPSRSIEVNSSSSTAYGGGGAVDLSHAGPADSGTCTTGTGADFDVHGGAATNPGVSLGSTGHYVSKASPIDDPLATVPAPTPPTTTGTNSLAANGVHGCTTSGGCIEYTPGLYPSLKPGNNNVIFDPGVYYVQGGGVDLKQTNGGGGPPNFNAMCVGCTADANTGNGMVIYDTVPSGTAAFPGNTNRPTGGFTIDTLAQLTLKGATNTTTNSHGQTVPGPPYYGVLFWEDRTANAQTHTLGQGNGCFSLIGTIYITNTKAIMLAHPTQVQAVTYHGTPCSTTINIGDIIVGQLALAGNTAITMNLQPYGYLNVRQVAMIN